MHLKVRDWNLLSGSSGNQRLEDSPQCRGQGAFEKTAAVSHNSPAKEQLLSKVWCVSQRKHTRRYCRRAPLSLGRR